MCYSTDTARPGRPTSQTGHPEYGPWQPRRYKQLYQAFSIRKRAHGTWHHFDDTKNDFLSHQVRCALLKKPPTSTAKLPGKIYNREQIFRKRSICRESRKTRRRSLCCVSNSRDLRTSKSDDFLAANTTQCSLVGNRGRVSSRCLFLPAE